MKRLLCLLLVFYVTFVSANFFMSGTRVLGAEDLRL